MEYVAATDKAPGMKLVRRIHNDQMEKERAVIVVHGIFSNCLKLKPLVDAMTQHAALLNCDIYAFDYDFNNAIHDNGRLLLAAIQGVQVDNDYEGWVIVGHSMGGLVARSALLQHNNGSLPINLLIMLGSPNFGAVNPALQAIVGSMMVSIGTGIRALFSKKQGLKDLTKIDSVFEPYIDSGGPDIYCEYISIPGLCYHEDGNGMRNPGLTGWLFKAINGASRAIPLSIKITRPHDGIVERRSTAFVGAAGRVTEKDGSIDKLESSTYTHVEFAPECRRLHHCQLYEDKTVNQHIVEIVAFGCFNAWYIDRGAQGRRGIRCYKYSLSTTSCPESV